MVNKKIFIFIFFSTILKLKMAGRPRVPNFIVENVLLIAELRHMDFTCQTLFEFREKHEWVLFCAQMGLIQNNFHCDQCNSEMAFVNYALSIDRCRWECRKPCRQIKICMRIYVVVGKCVVHHFTIKFFLDS